MTIASTARKAGPLLGDGSATTFPFTFKVFATGDIKVAIANSAGVETALVEGVNYSVSLNANQETSPGGTVTYPISGSPLPSGSVLSIIGDLDYDQPLDLPSGGNFNPLALENQLDRATMQIQQLKEAVDRSAKLPQTSSQTPDELVFNITRLGESADNIDAVAVSLAAVNTTAGSIADVNTVAGSIGNVNATGDNIDAVVTVANDLNEPVSEIETVAANITNVNATGGNIANVNAVAGISANVTAVAGIAADVTIVADNVADVSNFADVYYGPSATNPTLRKDGSALQGGDLYFNTGTRRLRVYDGTTWVDGPVNAGTITRDTFSGTGAQTAFTLSADPVSENNTQVYIGGVYQQKSEYSVNGTTLTFSAAPVAGTDNIEVVVITTLALGTTTADLVGADDGASGSLWTTVAGFIAYLRSSLGASTIGFIQAGVGAVYRTMLAKTRETVSLTDYFDGTGDPAAALTAALAVHSTVTIPPGDYVPLTRVAIPNNKKVYAEVPGATNWKMGADVEAFTLGAYSELDGLAIYPNTGVTHTKNLVEVGSVSLKADRAKLSNLRVLSAGNDGIQIINGNVGSLHNIQSRQNGRDGLHFTADTADNNTWAMTGMMDLGANGRDNLHLAGVVSVGNANNSRTHSATLLTLQSAGRYNLYINSRSNVFPAVYCEAATTADVYFDTYASGNRVTLVECGGYATVQGPSKGLNLVETHSMNADYLRGFWTQVVFSGRNNCGWAIAGDDGTAGIMTMTKTAVREFRQKFVGSTGVFNVYWENANTAGNLIGRFGGPWVPSADNSYRLGEFAARWSEAHIGKACLYPGASVTPTNNGELNVQATSNTQITFKLKGSDGVVRSGSITLA